MYNLPLLLAFDVLGQVLREARKQGCFACKRGTLGDLMDAAKTTLVWIDWDELRAGVHRRNGIAHDGELFSANICGKDIENIQGQLVAWGVIGAV